MSVVVLAAIQRVRELCDRLDRSPYATARPATIRRALDGDTTGGEH